MFLGPSLVTCWSFLHKNEFSATKDVVEQLRQAHDYLKETDYQAVHELLRVQTQVQG